MNWPLFYVFFRIRKGVEVLPDGLVYVSDDSSGAYNPSTGVKAVAGGAVGIAISTVIKQGCKRGVFSNEAGLGSSVMVHSNSNVKEPVKQGLWGIFEVFADTFVVCTMTALVVLNHDALVAVVHAHTVEVVS